MENEMIQRLSIMANKYPVGPLKDVLMLAAVEIQTLEFKLEQHREFIEVKNNGSK